MYLFISVVVLIISLLLLLLPLYFFFLYNISINSFFFFFFELFLIHVSYLCSEGSGAGILKHWMFLATAVYRVRNLIRLFFFFFDSHNESIDRLARKKKKINFMIS